MESEHGDQSNFQIVAKAEALKQQGNEFFRNKDYKAALSKYAKIPLFVNGLIHKSNHLAQYSRDQINDQQQNQVEQLKHTSSLNMAACLIALQRYQRAILKCNEALDIRENHKAFYRRAVAYLAINDLDRAKADLDKASMMVPDDPAINREYVNYMKKMRVEEAKAKKTFAGMFDRMAQEEEVKIEEYEDNQYDYEGNLENDYVLN